jgi:acyl-CoA thioesterase I
MRKQRESEEERSSEVRRDAESVAVKAITPSHTPERRHAGTSRTALCAIAPLIMLALVTLNGCSGSGQGQSANRVATDSAAGRANGAVVADTGAATQTPLPPGSSVDPARVPRSAPTRMLFIGTSLTAGYGLPDPSEAWPAEVDRIADSLGYPVTTVNAGLSGETSAGALRRTDWLLRDSADVVVIETGANDGLRGTSVSQLQSNLTAIVAKVRTRLPKAEVVIVQMEAPPNLGARYADGFRKVFPAVATATGATLTPFLLEGVAGVASLNQGDGIHPTKEGAAKAARVVWPTIRGVLDRVRKPVPVV